MFHQQEKKKINFGNKDIQKKKKHNQRRRDGQHIDDQTIVGIGILNYLSQL